MRFLILGAYYSRNFGDGVICECVAARLARHFPEAEIQVRDVRGRSGLFPPDRPSLQQNDYLRKRGQLRHFVTRYTFWDKEKDHQLFRLAEGRKAIARLCAQEWDLVIFAGGQMFMDGYALYLEEFVRQLNQRNIPVLFNACGTGPAWSPYVRRKLTAALTAPNVRLVSTRDNVPLLRRRYLRGKDVPVIPVSDPALWCPEVYPVTRKDSGVIGLGVMYPNNVNVRQEEQFWLSMIEYLERQCIPWQFFVNGDPLDLAYANRLISLLPPQIQARSNLLAPAPGSPSALVETVAQYRGIISFRLHSHIIAASLGIPGVSIYWDDKLTFFYKKLGYPQRCKTVRTSPREVWEAWEAAAAEGLPADLIRRQREASEHILVDAIHHALEEPNYDQ